MKKRPFLLIAAWLCCVFSLRAQVTSLAAPAPTDSLRLKLNQVFSPLNKSQVPTGWLEEYGTPLIPLDVFNNTLTDSSRTDAQVFRFLYATLYSSRIYGSNSMPTLATVNSRINTIKQTYPGAIPIAVMRWDYATIRPDAVSANLLRVQNEQLYDVAGRTQSPYLTKSVFAAAPARSYSQSGTVSFVFHQNITFNNGVALSLSKLSLDLGTGQGYKGVAWGTPITANYTTKGTKRIKVKFTYTNGQEMQSHFDLEVLEAACPTCRYNTRIDSIPFAPVAGRHSGGTVHLRYGLDHTQLVRPLIVAEGYDASTIAPDVADAYTIDRFMSDIGQSGWPSGTTFRDALDNIGFYDIVFIDYANGTDDIRRNAALFEDVVAWVNRTKVGMERNVVMGLSMGGLVARYGLARMEKAQPNSTQTRLLITHDSPHRGANTPLGLQALTRQSIISLFTFFSTADLSPALDQSNRLLDEPATRQLLILRATDANSGAESSPFVNGEYRNMITFSGTQPPYRLIATSQGSQCGVGSLAPYAELVRSTGEVYLWSLPFIKRRSIQMDIIVNALPPFGQSQRISHLHVYSKRRIAGLINITVNLMNKSYNSPTSTLPWDGLPGGTQNIASSAGSKIPSVNIPYAPLIEATLQTQLAGDFCFVPTISALDIADLNTTTANGTYVGGLPSASVSRVNNFIAQERDFGGLYNLEHLTFTARNSEWLFKEMQGATDNTLNCSSECNPLASTAISGNVNVCNATTYSVPVLPGTVSYQWSWSGNLSVVSGQNTPSITLQPNGSGGGTVNLTIVRNRCSFPYPTKTVQVNGPDANQYAIYINSSTFPQTVCPGGSYSLVITGPAGVTYSDWTFSGQASGFGSGNQSSLYIASPLYYAAVTVNVTNACGTSIVSRSFGRGATCRSGNGLVAYPNPANKYVEVSSQPSVEDGLDEPAQAREGFEEASLASGTNRLASPVVAKLYNRFSQLVWSTETIQPSFRIDTSKLPDDTYFLHLTQDGNTTKRQLVIQH